MTELPVSLLTAAALAALLVGLASRVSQLRMRFRIPFGDGGNPALMRAIRTHGNTTEHAPIFIVLVLACELAGGTTVFLGAAAGTFVLARVLFTVGVLGRGLHVLRMAGAGLSYLLQLVLAGLALWLAIA